MSMGPKVIRIELIYATPEAQVLHVVEFNDQSTVKAAIEQSNILVKHPELSIDSLEVGIFGKKVDLDTVLNNGDRIEIYRPLTIDPKEARRLRAEKKQ